MEIKTTLELVIGHEEHTEILGRVVKAMAQEVKSLGKTDFSDYSEEDIRRLAAAAFQVSVSSVFSKGLDVNPPFEISINDTM